MHKRNFILSSLLIGFILTGCSLIPGEDIPNVKLELSKTIYQKGQQIEGKFIVINNSDEVMVFNFSDAKTFGLIIIGDNNTNFEIARAYAQDLTQLVLKSKEQKEYTFKRFLKDNQLNELDKGKYLLKAYFNIEKSPSTTIEFEIQ